MNDNEERVIKKSQDLVGGDVIDGINLLVSYNTVLQYHVILTCRPIATFAIDPPITREAANTLTLDIDYEVPTYRTKRSQELAERLAAQAQWSKEHEDD